MSIIVTCPSCANVAILPNGAAGRSGKCRKCSGKVNVPGKLATNTNFSSPVTGSSEAEIIFDPLPDSPVASMAARQGKLPSSATASTTLSQLKDQYARTPFHRRNGFVSLLVWLGVICGLPVSWDAIYVVMGGHAKIDVATIGLKALLGLPLILASAIVLMGDVYVYALDSNGQVKRWSKANRYVAGLLVVGWLVCLIYVWGKA